MGLSTREPVVLELLGVPLDPPKELVLASSDVRSWEHEKIAGGR